MQLKASCCMRMRSILAIESGSSLTGFACGRCQKLQGDALPGIPGLGLHRNSVLHRHRFKVTLQACLKPGRTRATKRRAGCWPPVSTLWQATRHRRQSRAPGFESARWGKAKLGDRPLSPAWLGSIGLSSVRGVYGRTRQGRTPQRPFNAELKRPSAL